MDPIEIYDAKKEKFYRRTLLSSGLALLLAAASRLPTWEVQSPVAWLLGTVNVGFLPVFGPIVVFGLFCSTVVALRDLMDLRRALLPSLPDGPAAEPSLVLLRAPQGLEPGTGRFDRRVARVVLALWVFAVPVLSYGILVSTYFDFVRPAEAGSLEWKYDSRGAQVLDLLVATGGWSGFQPLAPSIQDNLEKRASAAEEDAERQRLLRLARSMPWIYPPVQTWAYLGGFVLLGAMAFRSWRDLRTDHPLHRRERAHTEETADDDDAT